MSTYASTLDAKAALPERRLAGAQLPESGTDVQPTDAPTTAGLKGRLPRRAANVKIDGRLIHSGDTRHSNADDTLSEVMRFSRTRLLAIGSAASGVAAGAALSRVQELHSDRSSR